jgi:hypothetical protein
MSDLTLHDDSDEVPVARYGSTLEARVMARVLLDLTGEQILSWQERELCEGMLLVERARESEVEAVRDLYAKREREALLRGEKWEGGGL